MSCSFFYSKSSSIFLYFTYNFCLNMMAFVDMSRSSVCPCIDIPSRTLNIIKCTVGMMYWTSTAPLWHREITRVTMAFIYTESFWLKVTIEAFKNLSGIPNWWGKTCSGISWLTVSEIVAKTMAITAITFCCNEFWCSDWNYHENSNLQFIEFTNRVV